MNALQKNQCIYFRAVFLETLEGSLFFAAKCCTLGIKANNKAVDLSLGVYTKGGIEETVFCLADYISEEDDSDGEALADHVAKRIGDQITACLTDSLAYDVEVFLRSPINIKALEDEFWTAKNESPLFVPESAPNPQPEDEDKDLDRRCLEWSAYASLVQNNFGRTRFPKSKRPTDEELEAYNQKVLGKVRGITEPRPAQEETFAADTARYTSSLWEWIRYEHNKARGISEPLPSSPRPSDEELEAFKKKIGLTE